MLFHVGTDGVVWLVIGFEFEETADFLTSLDIGIPEFGNPQYNPARIVTVINKPAKKCWRCIIMYLFEAPCTTHPTMVSINSFWFEC